MEAEMVRIVLLALVVLGGMASIAAMTAQPAAACQYNKIHTS